MNNGKNILSKNNEKMDKTIFCQNIYKILWLC